MTVVVVVVVVVYMVDVHAGSYVLLFSLFSVCLSLPLFLFPVWCASCCVAPRHGHGTSFLALPRLRWPPERALSQPGGSNARPRAYSPDRTS